jgi:gas vesicle protein
MSKAVRYSGFALLGGAVGAAVALLYAPASGAETRRRLAYRIDEERAALGQRSRAIQDSIREGRRRLASVVNG